MTAAKFIPLYSIEDKAIGYGITGGVAKYLSMIDSRKSIDDNIMRLFFRMDVNAFCCFATLTDTH